MNKQNYNSPNVKEINLSIKRSVCQNVSPVDSEIVYELNEDIKGNDDF